MAQKQHVAVWYDREGDFLEVMFGSGLKTTL